MWLRRKAEGNDSDGRGSREEIENARQADAQRQSSQKTTNQDGWTTTLQRRNQQRMFQRRNHQRDKSSQCVFKIPAVKNEVVNEVVSEVVNEINSSTEMRKTVKINDYKFDALIDTGSNATLVRYSVFANLGIPTLNPTKIKLTAFGKGEIQPIGSFKSTIDIQNIKI
ncbi:hypothetical protein TNCV_258581 [Trichonephila clavipes]|uniref:Peptidase A2 domain-containing protein n=1 Tax=Trichonephila clavipes TaxID=2585209 RepID=A0A8X6RVU0_TRICX|nr:hypothetical protein TNCV_258581 [Trichonephila clavipes]